MKNKGFSIFFQLLIILFGAHILVSSILIFLSYTYSKKTFLNYVEAGIFQDFEDVENVFEIFFLKNLSQSMESWMLEPRVQKASATLC